jgi:hypothetical protein
MGLWGRKKTPEKIEDSTDKSVKAVEPPSYLTLRLNSQTKSKQAFHGRYFRTSSFKNLSSAHSKNNEEYLEAVYDPNQEKWTVKKKSTFDGLFLENLSNPQVGDADSKDKGSSYARTVSIKNIRHNVCFFEALHTLAVYEVSQLSLDESLNIKRIEQDYNGKHYIDFAHREDIIFDRYGMPHLTSNGHPIDPGDYLEKELDTLKSYNQETMPAIIWNDQVLSIAFDDVSGAGLSQDQVEFMFKWRSMHSQFQAFISEFQHAIKSNYGDRGYSNSNIEHIVYENEDSRYASHQRFRNQFAKSIVHLSEACNLCENDDLKLTLDQIYLKAHMLDAMWAVHLFTRPEEKVREEKNYIENIAAWSSESFDFVCMLASESGYSDEQVGNLRLYMAEQRTHQDILKMFHSMHKEMEILSKQIADVTLKLAKGARFSPYNSEGLSLSSKAEEANRPSENNQSTWPPKSRGPFSIT